MFPRLEEPEILHSLTTTKPFQLRKELPLRLRYPFPSSYKRVQELTIVSLSNTGSRSNRLRSSHPPTTSYKRRNRNLLLTQHSPISQEFGDFTAHTTCSGNITPNTLSAVFLPSVFEEVGCTTTYCIINIYGSVAYLQHFVGLRTRSTTETFTKWVQRIPSYGDAGEEKVQQVFGL